MQTSLLEVSVEWIHFVSKWSRAIFSQHATMMEAVREACSIAVFFSGLYYFTRKGIRAMCAQYVHLYEIRGQTWAFILGCHLPFLETEFFVGLEVTRKVGPGSWRARGILMFFPSSTRVASLYHESSEDQAGGPRACEVHALPMKSSSQTPVSVLSHVLPQLVGSPLRCFERTAGKTCLHGLKGILCLLADALLGFKAKERRTASPSLEATLS